MISPNPDLLAKQLQEAKEIKDEALSFGTEEGSIYFGVERRGY